MQALSELNIICWRFGGGKGFERRTQIGGWEQCKIVHNDDDTVSVLSPNGDTWLSIELDGSLGERNSSNPPGSWERFTLEGNILTELHKEGVTRSDSKFLLL